MDAYICRRCLEKQPELGVGLVNGVVPMMR